MHPYIDFGFFSLPTYGLMIAVAILELYFFTTIILEKREKWKGKIVDRILIITLISFVLLGISAYLLNSIFHSISSKRLNFGGFTWLGGVLIGFPVSILLFNRFSKADYNGLTIFNYVLPGVILAHGIGRIGCLLAGCCFGGPTDSIFGIIYPKGSEAYYCFPNDDRSASIPLWPTQLFETAFDTILFIILIVSRRKTKEFSFEIYCFSYGVFRFLLEYMRADDRGSTGFVLTPSQVMSIILILYGIILILFQKQINLFLNEKSKNHQFIDDELDKKEL